MRQVEAKTTIMRARMIGLIGPKRAKFLNVMILRSDLNPQVVLKDLITQLSGR